MRNNGVVAERLLKLGASPCHIDSKKFSLLHYAAINDNAALATLLVESGLSLPQAFFVNKVCCSRAYTIKVQ